MAASFLGRYNFSGAGKTFNVIQGNPENNPSLLTAIQAFQVPSHPLICLTALFSDTCSVKIVLQKS
ncbi:MAG: hypothetical protein M3P08_19925 [Thermoproteota archaeon]|nr:hypothetical protein [Thermoproteota archaeon]